jgi:hypothetical protein
MGIKNNYIFTLVGFILIGVSTEVDAQWLKRSRKKNQTARTEQIRSVIVEEKKLVIDVDTIVQKDTINDLKTHPLSKSKLDVAVLLPFRKDLVPLKDKIVQDTISGDSIVIPNAEIDTLSLNRLMDIRRDMRVALEFYEGLSYAIDSLSKLGLSISLKTYDTELSTTVVDSIFSKDSVLPDAVVGPLSPRVFRSFVKANKVDSIPILAPLMSPEEGLKGQVYFGVPDETELRDEMIEYALSQYRGERVFVVSDNQNIEAFEKIKSIFIEAEQIPLYKNVSIESVQTFRDTIVDSIIPNWTFVETKNAALAASVSSILSGIESEPVKSMRMFTTTPSSIYTERSMDPIHLSNLEFSYPEVYGFPSEEFIEQFYEDRGYVPEVITARAFDLSFDFFLRIAVETANNVVSPQVYSSSSLDYKLFGMDDFQNTWYRLARFSKLEVTPIDSRIPAELIKPWRSIPEHWFCDYLLETEKQLRPEAYKLLEAEFIEKAELDGIEEYSIKDEDSCELYLLLRDYPLEEELLADSNGLF